MAKHRGKPQGVTYAQVLAQRAALRRSIDQAARDETVRVLPAVHTQGAMGLMVCTFAYAYGSGPRRLEPFFRALQANADELEAMIRENDTDYAYEKLRRRAQAVTGMDVKYLFE